MREKLIEVLKTVVSPKEVHCDGEVLVSTARVADHLIANGVTIQQWIPVTERLPEYGDTCLVVVKYKYDYEKEYDIDVDVATYNPDGGYIDFWDTYVDWNEGQQDIHVTHWMPLPEPPKESPDNTERIDEVVNHYEATEERN